MSPNYQDDKHTAKEFHAQHEHLIKIEDGKVSGRPCRPHGLSATSEGLLRKMVLSVTGLVTLLGLAYKVLGGNPSLPWPAPPHHSNAGAVKGTSFLDHEAPIAGFYGRTFLRDNIPYLDIPDQLIQDVYYYRWTSIQRNIRYVTAGTGYMLTEFVHPVGYAKAFGTIDAAAGHQIDEVRWFRNTVIADDYIQLYTRGPADPLQYTQWILDAANRRSMLTGDIEYFTTQLDDMIRVWNLWDQFYDSSAGMYFIQPVWDAQELSLPGFIADPNNTNFDLRKDGPDTYRPSHNAYMVANARAIARAAALVHDDTTESEYSQKADTLEETIYDRLWAPEQEFFMDVIRPNNPNLTRLTGREQVGLFPFRFGIGLNESYAQPSLDSLFDPQGFYAAYGPTTLEIRDPWFAGRKPTDYCCWWNGMSWPYSTSHTLKSMAAIYRAGVSNMTAEQYHIYLEKYAQTQQKNGMPYVAESHYPFENEWSRDESNHSEHYDHSTNNDDVITGLLGILPQADDTIKISPIIPSNWTYFALENLPYHGHLVTVLYDSDGTRYNAGSGLSVYVDGAMVHRGANTSATIAMPPATPSPNTEAPINIAANPDGPGQYPTVNATFTYAADWAYEAIDGVLYYDILPNNRWSDYTSPNTNDTLTVTFARPRKISSVTLALYSDRARGGSIDVPARIEIYGSQGLISVIDASPNATHPRQLLANDKNEFHFRETDTTFIAVNLFRQSPSLWVGVCELEVWTPPYATAYKPGTVFYAVDAHLTGGNTSVVFDNTSLATANGAVVGNTGGDSAVAFSGVIGDSGGDMKELSLSYKNPSSDFVSVDVLVNQATQTTLTLKPTGGKYGSVRFEVELAVGKNFVTVFGGGDGADVRFETLTLL
ncbi:Six-hairpin glycosidase-like protein [Astrocystis sublimbata]|nr:Six-hairpin glycosidase-like protein [Astrocystis sublimbata]